MHVYIQVVNPLEPLLHSLQNFSSLSTLETRIIELYEFLDNDDRESLSLQHFNDGLRRLKLAKPISIAPDDWEHMVVSSGMCDENGGLDKKSFLILIKTQLRQHVMQQVVASMTVADPIQQAMLAVMKLTLSQLDPATRWLRTDHTCCIETALRLRKNMRGGRGGGGGDVSSEEKSRANAQNQRGGGGGGGEGGGGDGGGKDTVEGPRAPAVELERIVSEEGEGTRGGGNDIDSMSSCSDADDDKVDMVDMHNSYMHSMPSKYKSMKLDIKMPHPLNHAQSIHSSFGQEAMGSDGNGFGRLSCHQDSTVQGWVYKKSDWRGGSTFKSRWMTLTKDSGDWHLNYYLDDETPMPQGSLCCSGLKIEEDAGLSGKLFCFAITPTQGTSLRRRVCACDTAEQRMMWY